MINIFYIFLALMGLNFLVFIHELGHYIIARREGMRVDVFSIGFGKPLISWKCKGVKWQLCPFLVGGYVRIAGMDKEGELEPHELPDGFYSKKPWARIKVALAGPVANFVCALLLFGVIWGCGGREKPFSQFTKLIGYMDPHSELYQKGVRPGDEIIDYNGKPFSGYQDLIYAAIMNGHAIGIEGNKIDYVTRQTTPYHYTLTPYEAPQLRKGFKTIGVLAPAMYLIYKGMLYPDSPLANSGIEPYDRIVWVNGELIFSNEQLMQVLNSDRVLLTIEREGKIFLGKVPRVSVTDLYLSPEENMELNDWKYDAGLRIKGGSFLFVPYVLSYDLFVQKGSYYINDNSKITHTTTITSSLDTILQPKDRILAVDGVPVQDGATFLKEIQTPRAQVIVKREGMKKAISWKEEDHIFKSDIDWQALFPIVQSIGLAKGISSNKDFYLLNSITPIRFKDFPLSKVQRVELDKQIKRQKKEAEKIMDFEEKEEMLAQISKAQNRFMLGVSLQDHTVVYNPNALVLFVNVFQEITRNLIGLFSGYFHPKHFAGPLFIVQIMQKSWEVDIKEALFWLGAISLNLGVLNLFPIPVLDGGHVCFSLLEMVRKKPLKAKTMRRLIIPFVTLVIFLLIYSTYNDLIRIFGRFF